MKRLRTSLLKREDSTVCICKAKTGTLRKSTRVLGWKQRETDKKMGGRLVENFRRGKRRFWMEVKGKKIEAGECEGWRWKNIDWSSID